ncbi:C2 domain-containing protein 5 [Sparganum proliferum]
MNVTPPGSAASGYTALLDCRILSSRTRIDEQKSEFPFLTITHPPPGLIRHFGCAVAAKSVKLLEKNVADDPSVQASWWLELRTEALTHMQHVNCDALIGYREDCAIFEDVCVLSCHATAVHLNSNWVHRPPGTDRRRPPSGQTPGNKVNSEMKAPRSGRISPAKPLPATTTDEAREGYAASVPPPSTAASADSVPAHTPAFPQNAEPDGSDGASVGSKLLNSEVPMDREVQNCSLCHIPQSDVSQAPQHFTRCSLCKSALVPEFIFSSTEFPSDFPINGRPALIQAGLCRSKKEDKGESAAREVSELLPFIEYELHYRLLQKLKLRGMNAIFGLSFQLSLGENLIALLATGTGVSSKALPKPKPPTVSEPANPHFDISTPALPSTLQQRVFNFSRECYERFGLIGDPKSPSAKQLSHPWTSDSCPATANLDSAVTSAPTSASPPKPGAYEPTSAEHEQVTAPSARFSNCSWDETLAVDQGTYFVDTRDPEPGEITFLLDDPFPPPSMLLSTTETPSSESVNWLARNLPQRDHTASGDVKTTPKAPTTVFWRPAYSFVKLHYLQGVVPDDALGSVFLNHRASALADQGTTSSSPESDYGGAVACRPSLRNQQSLPDFTQKYHAGGSLVCLADGLRNANRLTWFRFRTLMPCALTALTYRLYITEDSVIQIFNFGCLLVPYCAGSAEYANGDRDVIAFCGQEPSPTSPSTSRAKHSLGMRGLFSRPLGLLSFRESPSFHSQTHNTDSVTHSTDVHPACTSSLINAESTLPPTPTSSPPPPIPKSKPHFWSPLTRSAKNLFQIPFKSTSRAATCDPSVSRHAPATRSCRQSNFDHDKCLLTPLAYIPNYKVTSYFGNISFFFVRETTDLREMGGLRCFVHASVADAQSVISAHTISFGGNALLSYHISELQIIRPPSRNQAQCILNLCGDMAHVTPVV